MSSERFNAQELYLGNYDFDVYQSKPRLEYMIAAIPRTGSTYLAMELWRTGVMGAPLEYPNPPFRDLIFDRLNVGDSISGRWNGLKMLRTSSNGVFGFKMFIGNYLHYANNERDLLDQITPSKVIFLTRDNIEAQAISYSKAIQSGAWFSEVSEGAGPDYNAQHIYLCMRKIQYQIDFWAQLFDRASCEVHAVTYESLVRDRDAVVNEIAAFLGVSLDPAAEITLPPMTIQRNSESHDWLARYRREDFGALERACLECDDVE